MAYGLAAEILKRCKNTEELSKSLWSQNNLWYDLYTTSEPEHLE